MSGFKNRKDKHIWVIKNPQNHDNRVFIMNEKEHGWNFSPSWKNNKGEEMGSPIFPWPPLIQDLISDGIKPIVELVNQKSKEEEEHISEWRFSELQSIYQLWLLGWDIENKGYENIEEHIYEEKIEDKILMLEFAFDISKRIGIGMYIKRYSLFLKKLLKEIREDEKNPNFLADILEVYSQDWKEINDLGNK